MAFEPTTGVTTQRFSRPSDDTSLGSPPFRSLHNALFKMTVRCTSEYLDAPRSFWRRPGSRQDRHTLAASPGCGVRSGTRLAPLSPAPGLERTGRSDWTAGRCGPAGPPRAGERGGEAAGDRGRASRGRWPGHQVGAAGGERLAAEGPLGRDGLLDQVGIRGGAPQQQAAALVVILISAVTSAGTSIDIASVALVVQQVPSPATSDSSRAV
jgi:hypothetical protein